MTRAANGSDASPGRILLLDDDRELADVYTVALREAGHEVEWAATIAAAGAQLDAREFDLALLDLGLPDGSGLDVLRRIVADGSLTEAVVLTGQADVTSAVQALKLGAYDYLPKPVDLETLELVVGQALEKRRLRHENISLRMRLERSQPVAGLVTRDRSMSAVLAALERVAPSDLPVIIQGESGTGKELIARALHRRSPRAAQPFVAINCAAVPDSLIESALFGHERGAFTGAVERKPGMFEAADRGVLFLDEIGDVSPAVQAKLLRAIETHEFYRVGGTRAVRADVRVVTATNKDLSGLVAEGKFRDDLYFRLNGVTLRLPPLRARADDVAVLAVHFLESSNSGKRLSPEALAALRAYSWPGNVRELQMVVRRATILCPGDTIEPSDLALVRATPRGASGSDSLPSGLTLEELERRYIEQVLRECGGHRGRAAHSLGVSVKTLYNKLGPERPRS